MKRTWTTHTVVMGIALLATAVGAIIQFSALFDTNTVRGLIEKFSANTEKITLVLSIVAGFLSSLAILAAMQYKARKRDKEKGSSTPN